MIYVTDRKTHTLHHTHLKVRIKHYTQTHIILLVISIIIAIMPRMTRRWTFCWHKGGVSAAALDRTHNFGVQENHNGCWNTPITLIVINNSEDKKYRQPNLHQIGCATAIIIFITLVSSTHFYSSLSLMVTYSSTLLLFVASKGSGQIKFVRLKRDDISLSIVSY